MVSQSNGCEPLAGQMQNCAIWLAAATMRGAVCEHIDAVIIEYIMKTKQERALRATTCHVPMVHVLSLSRQRVPTANDWPTRRPQSVTT